MGWQFNGIFNGNNHIVSGVYINGTEKAYYGFFAAAGSANQDYVEIKNLGVVDSYIYGYQAGGITGYANANLLNCFFSGNVYGRYDTGGIVSVVRPPSIMKNLFVEGNCSSICSHYIEAPITQENLYVSSEDYTLIDFMKQYMSNTNV